MNKYGEVINNANLKDYNTYKIGGIAKYLVKPNSVENLKDKPCVRVFDIKWDTSDSEYEDGKNVDLPRFMTIQ